MSDPSDSEESPGTYVFPIPPRDGLFSRLSVKARATITTGEFAGALACAGVAWSVGGDMTLTVGALFVAWILGSIGIATVPNKSGAWRVLAIVGLFLILAAEGGFLYWHFHSVAQKETEKVADKPVAPVIQSPTPTPPSPEPSKQPVATSPKPKLISTVKRMVLVCDSPKPAKPQTQKERKVDLAKYADLMEKIFGYSVKSTLGDDELTLSVAPKSQSGVPFSVQQQTYFIKRVKDQLYVTVTTEISDADSFLGSVFLLAPVDADQSKEIVAKIEELTHAEAGKCKII